MPAPPVGPVPPASPPQGPEEAPAAGARDPRPGKALAIGLVLAAAVLAYLALTSRRPAPPRPCVATAPATGPTEPAQTAAPTPAPTETPTPEPTPTPAIESSRAVLPWDGSPTPTPTPEPTPTRFPEPSGSCVTARWRWFNSPTVFGEILVEVTATNRCARELGPLEVWFEVTTYQNGALIWTRSGHPFDPVDPGHEVKATIAVPGDVSIYDRVEVRVTAPVGPDAPSR
jgi:hypothetical protein